MGYWKSKVLPKIKKVFDKNGTKKAAAAEASESFDDSKEEYNKAFEEKKTELQPRVLEIYEASSAEIKRLVKDRNEAGLKKYSTAVHKFLVELVKIEFPGSKPASEACSKYGASSVSVPVFFVFEKVSTFINVTEEQVPETTQEQETTTSAAAEIVTEQEIKQEKQIVIEEEIKQETEKTETEAAKLEDAPAESAKEKGEEKSAEPVAAPAAADQAEPPKP